jgi:hypothetical protein
VKLVIFAVLIVVATRSREITNRLFPQERERAPIPVVTGAADDEVARDGVDEDDDELDEEYERRTLRRAVAFEGLLAVAILVVASLLVNAQPARSAIKTLDFAGGATDVTLKNDKIWVDVTAAPGTAGANDLHVNTLISNGGLTTPLDLTITFDMPSRHIAPLTVPLIHAGPGHYLSSGFEVPLRGNWRVTARVLLTPIDEETLVGTLTIR